MWDICKLDSFRSYNIVKKNIIQILHGIYAELKFIYVFTRT